MVRPVSVKLMARSLAPPKAIDIEVDDRLDRWARVTMYSHRPSRIGSSGSHSRWLTDLHQSPHLAYGWRTETPACDQRTTAHPPQPGSELSAQISPTPTTSPATGIRSARTGDADATRSARHQTSRTLHPVQTPFRAGRPMQRTPALRVRRIASNQ